jgi:hypothetical protein
LTITEKSANTPAHLARLRSGWDILQRGDGKMRDRKAASEMLRNLPLDESVIHRDGRRVGLVGCTKFPHCFLEMVFNGRLAAAYDPGYLPRGLTL